MIEQYPVVDGSRQEVVGYICFLHNNVNKRLGKPEFDCSKASEYWGGDCGCGAGDNEKKSEGTVADH